MSAVDVKSISKQTHLKALTVAEAKTHSRLRL